MNIKKNIKGSNITSNRKDNIYKHESNLYRHNSQNMHVQKTNLRGPIVVVELIHVFLKLSNTNIKIFKSGTNKRTNITDSYNICEKNKWIIFRWWRQCPLIRNKLRFVTFVNPLIINVFKKPKDIKASTPILKNLLAFTKCSSQRRISNEVHCPVRSFSCDFW